MTHPVKRHRRGLSKSKLLSWLQCPKRLWLQVHRPDAVVYTDAAAGAFTLGHDVGAVARRLHPRGVLIDFPDDLGQALEKTSAHLSAPHSMLFEPAFEYEGVAVRADILKKHRSGRYQVREVKASTGVDPVHLQDAAIQTWVLRRAGIRLDSIAIQHINSKFVYGGDGDYRGLFKLSHVDAEIRPLVREVPKWVAGARTTLGHSREPKRQTGAHCHDPYECPCLDYCKRGEPQV